MLKKRIIACLDVKDGKVVKGVQFQNHIMMGEIVDLALYYSDQQVDELVFYDITASPESRTVDVSWIEKIAKKINIPFSVAGGIKSIEDAKRILGEGAEKVSINSKALERPELIEELALTFGSQAVVVGIDSLKTPEGHFVYQYTGSIKHMKNTLLPTLIWAQKAQELGAGEIVLNCMNQDGTKKGFDLAQLNEVLSVVSVPIIASGGAGCKEHFYDVFKQTKVSGALAASVFHSGMITIGDLKSYLSQQSINVRIVL